MRWRLEENFVSDARGTLYTGDYFVSDAGETVGPGFHRNTMSPMTKGKHFLDTIEKMLMLEEHYVLDAEGTLCARRWRNTMCWMLEEHYVLDAGGTLCAGRWRNTMC